ncbi:Uncharacterised protein [Vibrio cholerae]|nr:Uncharacterised protein [Vibrio cholerae]CSD30692.1 Uncharacterised protein [Vibrio cholerae]CSI64305.1 Uncharacterised protein [Vibrio cholerae]
MRDHDGGNAQFTLQLANFFAQMRSYLGIESGKRFIKQ